MTTTRRITLAIGVLYVVLSGIIQIGDAIISARPFAAVAFAIGSFAIAYAIYDEIMKDVTK